VFTPIAFDLNNIRYKILPD